MIEVLDPTELAINKVRSMLSDYSKTSMAPCSEVTDGLLDIQQHLAEAIKLKDKEIDFALTSVVEKTPIAI